MKNTCDYLNDKLFHYVEVKQGKTDAITQSEILQIKKHLSDCPACRNEVEEIELHLNFLADLPHPQPSETLAQRCLQTQKEQRRWLRSPIFTLGTALAAIVIIVGVFNAGIWVGQEQAESVSSEEKFAALLLVQNELMNRLETTFAQKTSLNKKQVEMQFAELKYTSQMIENYYHKNESNYVARRSFQTAILRNILLLKSLCDYFENNTDKPIENRRYIKSEEKPIKL